MGVDRAGANAPVVVPLNAFPSKGGPMEARLHYRPAEPATARLDVFVGTAARSWTVDRSVLKEGLQRPAGVGDVQLWPSDDGEKVHARLAQKPGMTQPLDVTLDREQVQKFVDGVYTSVTPEEEGKLLARRLDDWLTSASGKTGSGSESTRPSWLD